MTPILHKLHPSGVGLFAAKHKIRGAHSEAVHLDDFLSRALESSRFPSPLQLRQVKSSTSRLKPKPRLLPLHPANVLCR